MNLLLPDLSSNSTASIPRDLSRKIFHDTVFAPSSSAFSKTIAALVRWVTQARNLGYMCGWSEVLERVKC